MPVIWHNPRYSHGERRAADHSANIGSKGTTRSIILNPLRLCDCDRPVNASAAYLFTTAERTRDMRQPPVYVRNHSQHNFKKRTRDMRQPPVYVRNHSQHNFKKRTTQPDLDEIEDWTDRAVRRMYEGAGLGCASGPSGGRSRPAWPHMSAVSELMPPEWDTTAMPGTWGSGVWASRCAISRSSS